MRNPSMENAQATTPTATKPTQKKTTYVRMIRPTQFKGMQETMVEGKVYAVDDKLAETLCDKKFKGTYPFSGERQTDAHDAKLGKIARAERISEEEYKTILAEQQAAAQEEV